MSGLTNGNENQMERRYLVAAYHHLENGFDSKLDYRSLEEAEKAAQGYVNGTMEDDGFKFDGAAVFDQQEQRYIRIYGEYPDERAIAEVNAFSADKGRKPTLSEQIEEAERIGQQEREARNKNKTKNKNKEHDPVK